LERGFQLPYERLCAGHSTLSSHVFEFRRYRFNLVGSDDAGIALQPMSLLA
jgi:hypothetical protein